MSELENCSPLPWTYDGRTIADANGNILISPAKPPSENDANARLIVKAVNLHKALQLLAGAAERVILDATGLQEQFNPETYEISAYAYLKLCEAFKELEAIE